MDVVMGNLCGALESPAWGTLLCLDGGLHAAEKESCWSSDDLS